MPALVLTATVVLELLTYCSTYVKCVIWCPLQLSKAKKAMFDFISFVLVK